MVENVLEFIREMRDELDIEEQIMFFIVFLFFCFSVGFLVYALIAIAFSQPYIFIPIYFIIFVLWQCYRRL